MLLALACVMSSGKSHTRTCEILSFRAYRTAAKCRSVTRHDRLRRNNFSNRRNRRYLQKCFTALVTKRRWITAGIGTDHNFTSPYD